MINREQFSYIFMIYREQFSYIFMIYREQFSYIFVIYREQFNYIFVIYRKQFSYIFVIVSMLSDPPLVRQQLNEKSADNTSGLETNHFTICGLVPIA